MKAYSIDLRQKIIDAYKRENISQSDLALLFGVSQSFVSKLLKQYRETGDLAPKPFRGGVKLTLNPKDLEILAELIEKNNDATLEELCKLLQEKTGIVISRATMGRMTNKLNFTWKRKTTHPTEKESERIQKLRREFWDKIRSVPVADLVFIDEVGTNLALVRLNARAQKGERARGKRPQKRGQNISTIGAITQKNILAYTNLLGAGDGLTFEAFVVSKLVPKLWNGAHVILDNSSIHKGEEVKKAIEEVGAKLVFLPPYSPEFNPIENCWSKVKSSLRSQQPRTYQDLQSAMEKALAAVSEKDLKNWFIHCCYGITVI